MNYMSSRNFLKKLQTRRDSVFRPTTAAAATGETKSANPDAADWMFTTTAVQDDAAALAGRKSAAAGGGGRIDSIDIPVVAATELPPVVIPPVVIPPVALPPVALSPVAIPPVAIPPIVIPPIVIPPVALPPVALPPVPSATISKAAPSRAPEQWTETVESLLFGDSTLPALPVELKNLPEPLKDEFPHVDMFLILKRGLCRSLLHLFPHTIFMTSGSWVNDLWEIQVSEYLVSTEET